MRYVVLLSLLLSSCTVPNRQINICANASTIFHTVSFQVNVKESQ